LLDHLLVHFAQTSQLSRPPLSAWCSYQLSAAVLN